MTKIQNSKRFWSLKNLNLSIVSDFGFRASNLLLAILFLTLTTAGHLGIGIIGIISTIPMLFRDLKLQNFWVRLKKLSFILASLFFILSYWIIPMLLANDYHIISFWDPIWKFNSYGWHEVVRQFLQGEIFDWQRFPIITVLATVGFFALLLNSRLFPFSLLFAGWILLYFGRTTWGGLVDLIPGMKDFHQHRFIVGTHVVALFLIPAGLEFLWKLLQEINRLTLKVIKQLVISNWGRKNKSFYFPNYLITNYQLYTNAIFYILTITFISLLAYFTIKQTIAYASLNNRWIGEANSAYKYDEQNFKDLVSYLQTLPKARIYAGRPGNWGKEFRLGSTQMYMNFGINGFDISQFLPETWSPLSENEQNFDERIAEDYDLLNIRYIVAPNLSAQATSDVAQAGNQGFTSSAEVVKKFGPFELYQVPTSGWFDVVSSPMFVVTDKTNYINLVHFWHRSYPRRWKMHPLISVERKPEIPVGMQKVITMTDEVSYQESKEVGPPRRSDLPRKNIFADFPFVFPEATVSARILKEEVNRQTYSTTVDVPANCKQCMIMFKMSYHPDWVAKVDGKDTTKFAVFPYYLAVQTEPGTHTVEFTYYPNRLKVALLVIEAIAAVLFLFRKKIANKIKL